MLFHSCLTCLRPVRMRALSFCLSCARCFDRHHDRRCLPYHAPRWLPCPGESSGEVSRGKGQRCSPRQHACRHDFYQTDSSIHVSVYVKGCRAEDVECAINETSLELTISAPSTLSSLRITPLFSPVAPSASSFKVLGSKIEIQLTKAVPGLHWTKLQGDVEGESQLAQTCRCIQLTLSSPSAGGTHVAAPPPASSTSTSSSSAPPPLSAPRSRSKWDSFAAEDESGKADEDASIDDFFKKLYADADDETRRAMMKSYQESGGTALSTNWGEVSKGKVKTSPPEGMEAKKW